MQAGTKRGWVLISVAFVALVVLGSCMGGGGGNDTAPVTTGPSSSGEKPVEDTAPKFATDAEAMAREFEKDSSAAEKRYKDTWVEVTGVVAEVDSTVKLQGGAATINCHEVPEDRLSEISKGDFVIVHGKFKELGDDGIEFEPCRLYLEGEGSTE